MLRLIIFYTSKYLLQVLHRGAPAIQGSSSIWSYDVWLIVVFRMLVHL